MGERGRALVPSLSSVRLQSPLLLLALGDFSEREQTREPWERNCMCNQPGRSGTFTPFFRHSWPALPVLVAFLLRFG